MPMIIYLISNKLTGKAYIGQTTTSLEHRWSQHKCIGNRTSPLKNALRKHGPDAFEVCQISSAKTTEELNRLEAMLIQLLGTTAPHGYNLRDGGGQVGRFHDSTKAAMRATWQDPEVRARRSAGIRAAMADPEIKARRNAALKAAHQTEEAKRNRSEASKKVCAKPEHRAKIAATCKLKFNQPGEAEKRSARMKASWARRKAEAACSET